MSISALSNHVSPELVTPIRSSTNHNQLTNGIVAEHSMLLQLVSLFIKHFNKSTFDRYDSIRNRYRWPSLPYLWLALGRSYCYCHFRNFPISASQWNTHFQLFLATFHTLQHHAVRAGLQLLLSQLSLRDYVRSIWKKKKRIDPTEGELW